ncbi:MAG: hypothetical protein SF028_09450 [Candidatus Sumerlaeia bacterium]|nr:hypothetical protein [Candidatus Sumerlaeia bacterium]
MIRFAAPEYLVLLLALPLLWWLARGLRGLGAGRRRLVVAVRTALAALLALALAQLEFTRRSELLSVYYLIDQSDSVPQEQIETSARLIQEFSRSMTARDEAGMVVFGATPSLESAAARGFEFDGRIASVVDRTRSDISGAVRLAMAAFPADRMRRIVLFSDGNENSGNALEAARLAGANGIPLDVVPLRYNKSQDVSIEKVVVPQQTATDAPFDVRIYVQSEREAQGVLRLFEDGRLIAEERVNVEAGRNTPYVLTRRLEDGGFHKYQATLDVDDDPRAQNNTGEAFTFLKAEPRVLLIEGDDAAGGVDFLLGALRAENIRAETGGLNDIPRTLDELQRYDSIILSNVPASAMTRTQMQMIERGVHDLGIGLVMIGGDQSYGAGGYQDTPIELALPVSMDIKQKRVLPNGALVVVLHTAEIAAGNAWAREIALASLNVLSRQDYFGILYYGAAPGQQGFAGGWGDYWAWDAPVQMAGDKRSMRTAIKGLAPGDMPSFAPAMAMAVQELKPLPTQVKHLVIISDGDPQPPTQATVNAIRDEGITVSTVAISPHTGQTVELMEQIAYWGAGEFYFPKTSAELPRIFTKEASVVRKSLISEQQFAPVYAQPSDLLRGLQDGLPPLGGIVVTTAKDLATTALVRESLVDGAVVDSDPVLAHWRYGLGKTVAFTSDAKNKWAAAWVAQPLFGKFWSQAVRWSLRETSSENYQVSTDIADGQGKLTIDAVDPEGNFRNYVEFDTTVLGPDLEPRKVSVRQVGPGRYEGTFPAGDIGSYMVSLSPRGAEGGSELVVAGASLSYSPEYETTRSNDDFLEALAKASGGEVIAQGYSPFRHNVRAMERPTPLWPLLLLLAVLLTPADVFFRRVLLDWSDARAWLAERRARRSPEAEQERLGSLKAAKERAGAKPRDASDAAAREEFRKRLDAEAKGAPAQPSVFKAPEPGHAPVRHRAKETAAGSAARPAEGGSMDSLLEAKRRARRRTGDGEEQK